jgi:hypothetical protein
VSPGVLFERKLVIAIVLGTFVGLVVATMLCEHMLASFVNDRRRLGIECSYLSEAFVLKNF